MWQNFLFERDLGFGHVGGCMSNTQHMEFSLLAFTQAKLPLILVGLPALPVIREVQRL